MRYEWNKGDKLQIIRGDNISGFDEGDIVIAGNSICTNDEHNMNASVMVEDKPDGDWLVNRFKKVTKGRPKKAKPIDRHIVIQDDCDNSIKRTENYEDAIKEVPGKGETYTIYKMVPVAKVENAVKVTKIK